MLRKALPSLAVLILLGMLLPTSAGLAGPPPPIAPQPFPFSDRYPAEVLLTTPGMLNTLVSSGADIANVRPQQAGQTFPGYGEPFVALVATVYVNAEEAARLAALGLAAVPIDNPSVPDYPGGPTACSGWPAYATLVARMQNLAAAYPNLVRLLAIGQSVQGRTLYAIEITDNPDLEEDEPEIRYSSTLHGTEGVGTEMTLRLAELLTSGYGHDPRLTNLVDNVEIWLMPLHNPDGYEACSYGNAHGVNLNRDFPDRFIDPVDDPAGREPETQAAMNATYPRRFVLGINYHSGALVVNYPWDAVAAPGDPIVPEYAPDDDIFYEFSVGYAIRNPMIWNGGFDHGVTRGWEWYQIWGGMQDWTYNWQGEEHVTIELSDQQPPPYNQMDTYWNNNREAMLWWMERTLTGARGLVTDLCTGAPLSATVDVAEIGKPVRTDPDVGDYHRMLLPGTYTLIASAPGYPSQSAGVTVISGTAAVRNFRLGTSQVHTVQGTVTEAGSGNPLAATVAIVGTYLFTQTNPADGHYILTLCPGTYTMRVSAPRHGTVERQVVVDGNRVEDFSLDAYAVAVGSSEQAGAPGETVTHTLAITNVGTAVDTYSLTLAAGSWPAAPLQDHLGPLAPGESGEAQVVVQIPRQPLTNTVLFSDVFSLYVTSTAVADVGEGATGTSYAIADLSVGLSAAQDRLAGPAGRPVTYTLLLTNTGAYTDAYALAVQGNAWPTFVVPTRSLALGPGGAAEVLVRVEIPPSPSSPTDTVTVQATSNWDADTHAQLELHTSAVGAGVAVADSQAVGVPGATVTHTFAITNVGTATDTYALGLQAGAWPASLSETQVGPLGPGESGWAHVVVELPLQPLTSTVLFSDVLSLYVTSTIVPEVGAHASGTTYAVADLNLALSADRSSAVGFPGGVITYTLTITNAGTYTDSYGLELLPGNSWPATVTPAQTPPLGPGASARAWVRVSIPAGAGGGSDSVTVRATSAWSALVSRSLPLATQRGWCIFLPVVVK